MKNENFNGREAMVLTGLSKIRTFIFDFFVDIDKKELHDGDFCYIVNTRDCYVVENGELVRYLPY